MSAIIQICYLVASVLFIFGIKGMTHPRTARRGNLLGASGMALAVVVTLFDQQIVSGWFIILGVVIGVIIGASWAIKVEMTDMPELVALFNGSGGIASALVAGAAYIEYIGLHREKVLDWARTLAGEAPEFNYRLLVATVISVIIGMVTFVGSLVAWAKLKGKMKDETGRIPSQSVVVVALVVIAVIVGALLTIYPAATYLYWVLLAVCAPLGFFLVSAIGGADMPVAIALLNSYSGLAAAATGFVLNNSVLIIAGSLVGASGLILTNLMCKAMNRSLLNVLVGGLGGAAEEAPTADEVYEGKIKSTSAEEVAMMFEGIRRFVVVPGYGMAVAQAQHAVRDLASLLEQRDVEVEYGIHPVAGRMPGHMNVLLAEADVSYDKLKDLDEINPTFSQTDIVMVIGANDVVNPEARENPKSAIAGMPILNVDEARTVIVVKRSLSPGYAGIPNPLFAMDNTLMYFADGKQAVLDVIQAMKDI